MEKHSRLPDPEQMSLVTGIILLAYGMSQYLEVPVRPLGLQLPGIYIPINFQFRTLVFITVALLAASGMDWMIANHPDWQRQDRIQHWLLPSLTAWVIGIPLYAIPAGPAWWGVFFFGGVLMVSVIISEYILVNPNDNRAILAGAGLSALSLALFMILAISIRVSGARLYVMVSAIGFGSILVCLRVFYMRSGNQWRYGWSVGVALLMIQLAAGFHYLNLSPVQFGLLLTGILYCLLDIAENILHGHFTKKDLIAPSIIMGSISILSVLLG
jgi:hypothetical protein